MKVFCFTNDSTNVNDMRLFENYFTVGDGTTGG